MPYADRAHPTRLRPKSVSRACLPGGTLDGETSMSANRELALFLFGLSAVAVFLLIKGWRDGIIEDAADEFGTPGEVATREDTPGAFWGRLFFFALSAVGCLAAGVYAWNHDLLAISQGVIHRAGQWFLAHVTVHHGTPRVILPALIALPGLLALAVTLWSYAWPSVPGRVEYLTYQRTLREGETSQTISLNQIWTLVLVYTYEVDGRSYSGTRIRPLGLNSAGAERALAQRLKVGAEVRVLYCPAWRRLSCLKPGGVGRALVLAGFCGGVLYVLFRAGLWN